MNTEAADKRSAFITGATGAVGTTLVRALKNDGWQVYALHRSTSDVSVLQSLGAVLIEGDIIEADTIVGKVPANIDVFYHVAADLNMWSRNNDRQMKINVDGTRNAVEAALQAGVGRFVHTSTVSTYGRVDGSISEDTVSIAGTSFICYERSKWLAEAEVRKGIERGLDAVIVNPCAIMGPGFTGGWATLLYQIKGDLMKALPPGVIVVNHVDDVVNAHIAAAGRGRTGENYILTGDRVATATLIRKAGDIMGIEVKAKVLNAKLLGFIARIANFASRFTGKEPDLTPEMAALMSQEMSCDTDKAARELGYKDTPWETCVGDMYNWLHARGDV